MSSPTRCPLLRAHHARRSSPSSPPCLACVGGVGAGGADGRIGNDEFGRLNCDCIAAEGLDEALCYGYLGDNAGPPNAAGIASSFARVQAAFPNAVVVGSTFDAFYAKLDVPAVRRKLDVLTEASGDTWVYGTATFSDII